jgi:spermidine synthase
MKRVVFLMAAACLLAGAAVAVWLSGEGGAAVKSVVQYDRESKYYRIIVEDYPDVGRRCLHFSKTRGIQSSMILAEPDALDFQYCKSMMAAMALHPAPKNILLIGLGGASIPKYIQKQYPDVKLDIVEIDPDVVKVCQDWFEFKPSANTRVITMDGRMYLKRTTDTYDLILLDAYAGDRVPFHLTTQEFIALVKSRLKTGGVVASNLWEHSINRFYYAELRTYQLAFPQVYVCQSGNSGNVIVFGSTDEKGVTAEEWAKRAEALAKDRKLGYDLPALIRDEYKCMTTVKLSEDKPLTDDMAPVDTLRRENPKYFEEGAAQ